MATSRPLPTTELPTVIYLDDSGSNRQAFQSAFRREFKVFTASTLEETLALLQQHVVHVVIADQRMPAVTGSEALRTIKERHPRVRRMLITAYTDLQAIIDALNHAGVCYYIQKPWEVESVLAAVRSAFNEFRQEEERAAYTERLVVSNQQLEFALRQRLLS